MDFPEFCKELEAEVFGAGAKLMGIQLLQLELILGKIPSRSFRPVKGKANKSWPLIPYVLSLVSSIAIENKLWSCGLQLGKFTAGKYVRPFEILERIGPVAYRLRLPEELSGVHDTFYVSNLKKCLAGASLHVPLNEIKVRWNSKRGLEFTWEREDYMKSNYTQLFVDRAVESAS
ncbi:hypothetical protein Tco_0313329 [Tanacetum coccineum]